MSRRAAFIQRDDQRICTHIRSVVGRRFDWLDARCRCAPVVVCVSLSFRSRQCASVAARELVAAVLPCALRHVGCWELLAWPSGAAAGAPASNAAALSLALDLALSTLRWLVGARQVPQRAVRTTLAVGDGRPQARAVAATTQSEASAATASSVNAKIPSNDDDNDVDDKARAPAPTASAATTTASMIQELRVRRRSRGCLQFCLIASFAGACGTFCALQTDRRFDGIFEERGDERSRTVCADDGVFAVRRAHRRAGASSVQRCVSERFANLNIYLSVRLCASRASVCLSVSAFLCACAARSNNKMTAARALLTVSVSNLLTHLFKSLSLPISLSFFLACNSIGRLLSW